jgi:hypothetical protein
MSGTVRLGILSDVHYACAEERARGWDYEAIGIPNFFLRAFVRFYRHFIWLRDPLSRGYLVDNFLHAAEGIDFLIANGDYSCDSAFVGVSDEAACQSVRECLGKLRGAFAGRTRFVCGDHELGKMSFFGGRGGMRLASWRRVQEDLGVEAFWQMRFGRYVCVGVTSSVIALPVFEGDTLAGERQEWEHIRERHLIDIRQAFAALGPDDRVLLFCHDPTALHFLGKEPAIQARFAQLEQTVIGHLHSNLVLWKSRLLTGMPRITFLGHTARRLSTALRQARDWSPFKVRLCPALAGIELLKDGGFLSAELDLEARVPAQFRFHAVSRKAAEGERPSANYRGVENIPG